MLLFLDFDGCCHSYKSGVDQYFRRSEAVLEPWLRLRPQVEVVVSSSWRETYSLQEMQEFFAEDLRHRIIDSTPVLLRDGWASVDGDLLPVRFEREAEILCWLRQSGQPWSAWAALDDQPWRFKPFCERLVVCGSTVGMTERELGLVDAILGRQR